MSYKRTRHKRGPLERMRSYEVDDMVFEFGVKAALTVVLGFGIIGGVALFGHHIAYWAAFLIAALFVWGGWIVLDGDWVD